MEIASFERLHCKSNRGWSEQTSVLHNVNAWFFFFYFCIRLRAKCCSIVQLAEPRRQKVRVFFCPSNSLSQLKLFKKFYLRETAERQVKVFGFYFVCVFSSHFWRQSKTKLRSDICRKHKKGGTNILKLPPWVGRRKSRVM